MSVVYNTLLLTEHRSLMSVRPYVGTHVPTRTERDRV